MKTYNKKFFDSLLLARKSAEAIITELSHYIKPATVVDVGGGIGVFLSVYKNRGAREVLNIDRDWVPEDLLQIDKNNFLRHDLTKPPHFKKRYDLAICLEVGEHLDKRYSYTLVKTLTSLSDVVLFSTAIPGQGGTHHVNEQWPQYWAIKFEKFGFVPIDVLRYKLWYNNKIAVFYRQNIFIYIKKNKLKNYAKLKNLYKSGEKVIPLVHPVLYNTVSDYKTIPVKRLIKGVIYLPKRTLKHSIKKQVNSGLIST